MPTSPPTISYEIDEHGNAGDGRHGRFGTCSECGRTNKVVGPPEAPPDKRRCVMPQGVALLNEPPESGCEAQRGPRGRRQRR